MSLSTSRTSLYSVFGLLLFALSVWNVGCQVGSDSTPSASRRSKRRASSRPSDREQPSSRDADKKPDPRKPDARPNPRPEPRKPDPKEIEALSVTELVYIDHVGDHQALFAFDLATNKSRRIIVFSQPSHPRGIRSRLRVSFGRTWITFAAQFPKTAREKSQGSGMDSVWVVSVDGAQVRRVSEPMSPPSPLPEDYTRYLSNPHWSHDGKRIFFTLSEYWGSVSEGTRTAVGSIGSVPFSGGAIRRESDGASCKLPFGIHHPYKPWMVMVGTSCNAHRIDIWNRETGKTYSRTFYDSLTIQAATRTIVWHGDMVLIAGKRDGSSALLGFDVKADKGNFYLALPSDVKVDSVVVSPFGQYFLFRTDGGSYRYYRMNGRSWTRTGKRIAIPSSAQYVGW